MSFFEPLIGQPQAVGLLTQAVAKQRIAPAYLFAGPDGIGRKLAARCFIEHLFAPAEMALANQNILRTHIHQGNHPDVLWVEPTYLHQGKRLTAAEAAEADLKRKTAPIIRLEQIREIGQFLARSALEAPRSVVVIEQAETMAEAPANALLKTLEEPGQATLILIARSVESLLPTLVSRCQKIPFFRLSSEEMKQVLQKAGHEELLQHPLLLQFAEGSPGAAIAHWQMLQTVPAELCEMLAHPPRSHREALHLARQIDQTLETEAQLWLIDYLQYTYWQQISRNLRSHSINSQPLRLLEKARKHLLSYVNARLVWEVTLMEMVS